MSKIFEAIQKGSGGAAEILPQLLKDQPAPVKAPPIPATSSNPVPSNNTPLNAEAAEHAADHGSVAAAVETLLPVSAPAAPSLDGPRIHAIQVRSDAPVLIFDQPKNRAGEQYRILRTKILHHPAHPRLILVSSPGPGDGKTVTAINLAGALSLKVEAKVLLVDTDFRRSSVHRELGLPKQPGLMDVLVGAAKLEEAVIRTQPYSNLYVLPAGETKPNPAELLDSPVWKTLVQRLRDEYQYVVLDSPPNAAVADYLLLQQACDGVVLVLRPDHTNRKLCQATLDSIPEGKNLGVVLNCVQSWFFSGASKNGYYYYAESED